MTEEQRERFINLQIRSTPEHLNKIFIDASSDSMNYYKRHLAMEEAVEQEQKEIIEGLIALIKELDK